MRHADGKFRFKPDWTGTVAPNKPPKSIGAAGPLAELPEFPDHVDLIEVADAEHPFRLATSPARSFLNSSFTETPGSQNREGRPELMIHPDDAAATRHRRRRPRRDRQHGAARWCCMPDCSTACRRGVVIAEGIWPNSAHERGEGINVLTGSDAAAPYGGAAFHDNKVWVRAAG